jgi:hypothetical protein
MSGVRPHAALTLLLGVLCLVVSRPAFARQPRAEHKPEAKQEQPAAKPLEPLTLEQMPATPPQVSYRNGELTIVAQNSTLGDILRAVHAETGALVDVPGNPTDRVVSQFGPGPPRDVLAKLLNGTHFNYVMLGSATNPNELARVILSPKPPPMPEQSRQTQVSGNQPRFFSPQMRRGFAAQESPETPDNNVGNMEDSGFQNDEDLPQPDDQDDNDQNVQQPDNRPVIKTPEQLLQELQRQQQELLRQQQQAAPGQGPTAPRRDR